MTVEYFTIDHLTTKDITYLFSRIRINPDISYNSIPCWEWHGSMYPDGYGRGTIKGKRYSTHRLMYAWLIGPIPCDLRVAHTDHLCRNTRCCNPLHLESVTPRENGARGFSRSTINRNKTHCHKGHPITEGNAYIAKGQYGPQRTCKVCVSERMAKTYKRNREAIIAKVCAHQKENRAAANVRNRRYKAKKKAERLAKTKSDV